ncbi:MAG TPA: branched-chain amino acid ABC transporter permease [Burkholderiales bacterium]|nr:branched-chain amino acid ABC transporter permease [Burkholderiales bacterium]
MAEVRFEPFNPGRWLLWGATAALFVAAPLVFRQGFAVTLMTQMGAFIIFALSYNMLLGQGGMLSFGHAVYSGLGAYFAVHALNMIGRGTLALPVMLLPLVGGLAGLAFGVIFGYVTTRRAGTTFAMISLGIGELVHACVLMFPRFFGGEGGVQTNRVVGHPFLGITFGPAIQVYYLVAFWCFVSMIAMFALTQTPLGRMANAVRDNPERAEFVGYDTQKVRFLQLVLAGFFAGISGALSCINFEIVTDENVSALRSGGVLLATFIGGTGFFFGPILGSVVFIFFVVALSGFTQAWLLYLGMFFLAMVLYAPGGIASIIMMQLPVIRAGRFRALVLPYLLALAAGLVAFAGLVGVVEMVYRISDASLETQMTLFGIGFDAKSVPPWIAFSLVLGAGLAALGFAARRVGERWGAIQNQIQGGRP